MKKNNSEINHKAINPWEDAIEEVENKTAKKIVEFTKIAKINKAIKFD